ncbi:DUF4010 domain-containing protein [Luteimonas sp. 50]|uniref:DUF4010 domain-containing protein n=1 Tax=Cognatiluteimonas sedimenti TaxID=2927791 RepID=A0ABT0A0W5_9GAMM|nr:DUF4010 domain-containing protein [Lysobacter sedimenti]MCJ0824616.1 DUF4010 domain-containing protein [Lysobacter sedimenti]
MPAPSTELAGIAVAAGIGLLVGIERERSKGDGATRAAAGVRTFLLLALTGAVAQLLGPLAVAVGGAFVALAALASYRYSRDQDPGLTTEAAMLLVYLLGVLAMQRMVLAAGLGVAVAVVLASKPRLHRFTRQVLTTQELHDILLLAAAAAIVLPLLPNRTIDPWQALNPRRLWWLVVLVMGIQAMGYVALRALGARAGLALAGLAGGFVSSTATIAAMGERSRGTPALAPACASAALLSNVGTVLQLAVVVGAFSPALLQSIAWPLVASGVVAIIAAAAWSWRALATPAAMEPGRLGRPFEPLHALAFVAIVAAALLLSAVLHAWRGDAGLVWAAGAAGLADVHAAAASLAQLVGVGQVDVAAARWPLVAALVTNSSLKLLFAFLRGGSGYGLRVLTGVAAMVVAFVLGLWLR